jgi:transcriptional regulator GlxA family with amidase domain
MTRRLRHVWFLMCPGAELLDLAGPWAVLGYANEILGQRLYITQLIAPGGGDIRTRHGLTLNGARSLGRTSALRPPETLVVAGGTLPESLSASEARVVRWLRGHHRGVARLISICTGAFVLGAAGLLDGRRATTHWRFVDLLAQRFPKVQIANRDLFVRDGRIWTSAGITAGIDLMLAMVEEDHGHAVAISVAKALVLFLRRSGGQAQFSHILKRQEQETTRLRELPALILEHLDRPLSVEQLAAQLGMSSRSLSRWCERELGESPAALVRRMRLEEARRLLEQTSLPLKDIASRTLIGDSSTLWRVFTRHLGVTPARYRARFTSVSGLRAKC